MFVILVVAGALNVTLSFLRRFYYFRFFMFCIFYAGVACGPETTPMPHWRMADGLPKIFSADFSAYLFVCLSIYFISSVCGCYGALWRE